MPARFAFPTGLELNKGRAGCCEVGEGCCHCLHGHDSFIHSVSSSITLISSARARFCLHFCQSSFLFSLFPRRGKKKRKRKRRQRHCQSEYWELWEHSDSRRHKTVRDVFDFANCGTFNNTKCLLLRCLPFFLSLCPFSAFLSCLPFIICDNSNSNKCRWLTLAVNNFHYYYFVSCGLSSTSHRTCLLPTYWLWRHVFPITNSSFFSVVVLIHLWH